MKRFFVLFIHLAFVCFISLAQDTFGLKLSEKAIELTRQKVVYDPQYYVIPYPNGDVPSDRGVCSDVVIRAYRKLGIDLQKEVHEDMVKNYKKYPRKWNLKKTDANIDHRRVPNLMVFFPRQGKVKSISQNPTIKNASNCPQYW